MKNQIILSDFDAIIFDMDGVLINSEPFWLAAEIEVFGQLGIDFMAVGGPKTVGLRIDEVVDYWFSKYPWEGKTNAEVVDEIVSTVARRINTEGVALEGVRETLAYCKQLGMKIGLASSSYQRLIDATLKKLEIASYFDAVHSAEFLAFGKPHPEIYLATADSLKVSPNKCLVIEDSLNGVIAAKAAKMTVVAIPDGTHEVSEKLMLADYRFASLDAFLASL
ncbi:MAG: hexitol phosphatase HxpB [Crocinitomicaceae bacterium]|nr:hexitol phosphatase HxpB [Crocinitomicaceae bacterium]